MEKEPERIVREIEILGLKQQAKEAVGGEMTSWEAEDVPLEIQETYWNNIVAWEQAPWVTPADELAEEGIVPIALDKLDDGKLPTALWALIRALAERNIFLEHTDHLSDRELYTWLWKEGLCERTKTPPKGSGWNFCTGPIGSASEEDMVIYHRFYATEESRKSWLKSFPDSEMPPREKPPYDRDRFLPQAQYPHFEFDGVESDDDSPNSDLN